MHTHKNKKMIGKQMHTQKKGLESNAPCIMSALSICIYIIELIIHTYMHTIIVSIWTVILSYYSYIHARRMHRLSCALFAYTIRVICFLRVYNTYYILFAYIIRMYLSHTYIHICIYTLFAYIIRIVLFIRTYIHAYTHTCIYTCIHVL